jgi:predicted MFS family arabinose efflux permease
LTPELVPLSKLEPAVALGGVSFNASRGIGAALGGLVVAALGTASVFLINAASFLTIIFVLLRWKRVQAPNSHYQRERIFGAIRAGIRYVQHSPGLISVLARCCLFATCASAMWALLPLVGRKQLMLDSVGYGLLLGVFGVGTLMGAFLMPVFRRHMSIDHLNSAGNLLFAISMVVLAVSSNFAVASIAMLGFGVGWIIVNSTLNVGAQMAVTAWVRARGMAVYILLFQGSVALGSVIWGQVALRYGLSVPLIAAAAIMCLNLICALKFKIGTTEGFDFTASSHWSDPKIVHEPGPDDGPVLITVEYVIDAAQAKEFAAACAELARQRRRDGAYQWHLFCDLANPTCYLEQFMVESHVRQHERVIVSDQIAEQKVDSFHIGGRPRKVRHMISAYASPQPPGIPAIVESTSEASA